MTIKLLKNEYEEMINAINKFKATEKRLPNYYTYKNIKIYKKEYTDAINRIQKFQKANGRKPNHVTIQNSNAVKKVSYNSDKDPFRKSLAAAIGGKFNTLTGCYNLIRKNESYANYQLDQKAQAQAVASLLRNTGLNCVDYSQIMAAVCDKLNKIAQKGYSYRYVRTYCVKSKVGHVYLEVKGAEVGKSLVPVDAAAGASAGSKYKIGHAWCMNYPDKIYNQEYLKLDDGRLKK